MKKSRHAVLLLNFSCVALMSLYNNHCFISSAKNEEEKMFKALIKKFFSFSEERQNVTWNEVCKFKECIDLSIHSNRIEWR